MLIVITGPNTPSLISSVNIILLVGGAQAGSAWATGVEYRVLGTPLCSAFDLGTTCGVSVGPGPGSQLPWATGGSVMWR